MGGIFFFFFLVLWPLRFPPVLTWLRLYNSPERVTSSRVEIPGLFFFLFHPISFFSFTGRVGWGWGAQLLWNICQAASCRGRANWWFMATSGRCKALVYAFNHTKTLVGLEIEKRWSDGVLWSPCWDSHWWQLVWTYYMTVGFLQLSVSKLKLPSAGVCTKRMLFLWFDMVRRFSSSFKIGKSWSKCFVT